MIRVKDVKKTYNPDKTPFDALKGVSIEIAQAESVAIIGKSGSGKSTLMHLMAGLDNPTEGSILFKDEDLALMNKKQLADLRNESYGFIFQQFFLLPKASVLENVILPFKIGGMSSAERNERGMEALREVGLEDKASNKGTNLSGGQKQRVAIARAIVTQPSVVFADEPTGNLDSKTGKQVEELLFQLNRDKKITLVVVTHDEDLAAKCERMITLKDGLIA